MPETNRVDAPVVRHSRPEPHGGLRFLLLLKTIEIKQLRCQMVGELENCIDV